MLSTASITRVSKIDYSVSEPLGYKLVHPKGKSLSTDGVAKEGHPKSSNPDQAGDLSRDLLVEIQKKFVRDKLCQLL